MRTAYRIVGSSTTKPENLPEGFEVRERLVGEVHQVRLGADKNANFVENKNGDVVVYQEGTRNSNFVVRHDDLPALFQFLNRVWIEHRVPLA